MALSRMSSEKAGILKTPGTYGLGVLVADFDNDGWPDIYVANDSTSSALYKNNHDGTFTEIAIEAGVAYSPDGKPQAGMGVSVADYDWRRKFRHREDQLRRATHRASTAIWANDLRGQTFQAGLGRNTRFLGWGVGFFDFDNDGWPDILVCNGHVYPEVGETRRRVRLSRAQGAVSQSGQRQVRGRLHGRRAGHSGDGRRAAAARSAISITTARIDVLVNCVNDVPQLLRCDSTAQEQLAEGEDGRSKVEPVRHRRANLSAPPEGTGRWTKCAAAAATFRRAICACISAWVRRKGRHRDSLAQRRRRQTGGVRRTRCTVKEGSYTAHTGD